MRRVNHRNVIRLYEIIDDPSKDKLYLVMPLAEYGESMSFDSQIVSFRPNRKLQLKDSESFKVEEEDENEFYHENTI